MTSPGAYGADDHAPLPGQCRAIASWNGETWHHCSRLDGHPQFHRSHRSPATWPVTDDGAPSWTAPWPDGPTGGDRG